MMCCDFGFASFTPASNILFAWTTESTAAFFLASISFFRLRLPSSCSFTSAAIEAIARGGQVAGDRLRAPTWRYCARCGPETRAVKMQAVERWRRMVAGGELPTLQEARGE